eukprot:gene4880-6086_t
MNENVIVAIRSRPFNLDEIKNNEHCSWSLHKNTITSLPPPSSSSSSSVLSQTTSPTLLNSTSSSTIKNVVVSSATLKTPIKTPIKSSTSSSQSSSLSSTIRTPIRPSISSSSSIPIQTPSKSSSISASASNLPPPSPSPSLTSKFVPNSYTFDYLFHHHHETSEIYETVGKNVIYSAMEGIHGSILAYGQTNSGKTYTMKGNGKKNPGIIPMAIQDVFEYISRSKGDREFLLRISYLEIYNEVINDLLAPNNVNLKIHEHPTTGIYVGNLKEEIVVSQEHVMTLISMGEAHRHVGTTNYNDQSSRSHTIFRLTIESKQNGIDQGNDSYQLENEHHEEGIPVRFSCINLIDLAGSEKASDGNNAVRNKEGAYINKSLLTLGTVISKLSDKSTGHIPYRDSKLTRLLQNSLSGNSRIVMICTISLAATNFDETHNTLKFAQRAKKIINNAKINEIIDDKALIKQYRNEIAQLKQKLSDAMTTEKDLERVQAEREKDKLDKEEIVKKLEEAEKQRTMLESKIQHLTKLILSSSSISNNSNSKFKGYSSPSQSSSYSLSASTSDLSSVNHNRHLTPSHLLSIDKLPLISSGSGVGGNSTSSSTNNTPLSHGQNINTNNEDSTIQLHSKIAKLELELEDRNKRIEFLNNLESDSDSGLEKIKELEAQLIQRDMDLSLYQRESTRLQTLVSQKEESIISLELKFRDLASRFKDLTQENERLKQEIKDRDEEMY